VLPKDPVESQKPDDMSLPVATGASIGVAGGLALALFIACMFCYGRKKKKDGNNGDDEDVDPFVGGDDDRASSSVLDLETIPLRL